MPPLNAISTEAYTAAAAMMSAKVAYTLSRFRAPREAVSVIKYKLTRACPSVNYRRERARMVAVLRLKTVAVEANAASAFEYPRDSR